MLGTICTLSNHHCNEAKAPRYFINGKKPKLRHVTAVTSLVFMKAINSGVYRRTVTLWKANGAANRWTWVTLFRC